MRALHNLTFVFEYIRRASSLRSNGRLIERSGAKSKYIWYFKGLSISDWFHSDGFVDATLKPFAINLNEPENTM
jgi:hypothetical protein